MTEQSKKPNLPGIGEGYSLLPLRDVVVFPSIVITLYVGRPFSIKSLEHAAKNANEILLVSQKNSDIEVPKMDDIYDMGCMATILDSRPLSDGTYKVLVEGKARARIENIEFLKDQVLFATARVVASEESVSGTQASALRRSLLTNFENYIKGHRKLTPEVAAQTSSIESLGRLTDVIVSHIPLPVSDHQEFLSETNVETRVRMLLKRIGQEQEISKLEKKIHGQVKKQIEKSHREFYLNEQAKAIQKELGDDNKSDLDELKKKIEMAGMTKRAKEKCLQEVRKLTMMPPMSAEASVVRSYLDTLLSYPWSKRTKTHTNLEKAHKQLDRDHYGLEKVKERILEYLAVQRRANNPRAPILCFVGPPGVGKTSLGRSIATATGRKFVRMSLGGVRDEAEIRGHRRTYVGSMAGKIMQGMARAEAKNPVFLLDEIDKMGMDFRGDPAAALLEVLDPEQNKNFSDHYVEVGFDLSEVFFISTSNSLNIPPALADRLEIIPISGYTENEKLEIARRHLIPKQLEENGLGTAELEFDDSSLLTAIRHYTREAGVRDLERSISKICRKAVVEIDSVKPDAQKAAETDCPASVAEQKGDVAKPKAVSGKIASRRKPAGKKILVSEEKAGSLLGVRQYKFGRASEDDKIGQVTGLAWTNVGGELLTIEVAKFKGSGKIHRTGKLGDVMKESIEAAVSVVRSRAKLLGISETFHKNDDIHVHLPEGGIPKDGPSAGIGIVTALVSVLTGIAARSDTAMTGEITLRGEILQIGGLKEKLLAAHRGGIKRVILPEENRKDMEEIPQEIKDSLEFHWVRWIDEVLNIALQKIPQPKRKAKEESPKDEPIKQSLGKQEEDLRDESVTH